MLAIRMIVGIVGVALLVIAFAIPDILTVAWENLPPTMAGLGLAAVLMVGVYLLFYAISGDWLPRLRKLRKSS